MWCAKCDIVWAEHFNLNVAVHIWKLEFCYLGWLLRWWFTSDKQGYDWKEMV